MRQAALALAAAAVLGACGQPGSTARTLAFSRPNVKLHHLTLRNAGLTGGTLDVVLAFYNPNRVTIPGSRIDAALDIGGNRFGDVVLADEFTLNERDTTLITVPLNFQWTGAALAARSVLNSGAVAYRIDGTATLKSPSGFVLSLPLLGEGNIPVIRP